MCRETFGTSLYLATNRIRRGYLLHLLLFVLHHTATHEEGPYKSIILPIGGVGTYRKATVNPLLTSCPQATESTSPLFPFQMARGRA
jgi:hypothetical protein